MDVTTFRGDLSVGNGRRTDTPNSPRPGSPLPSRMWIQSVEKYRGVGASNEVPVVHYDLLSYLRYSGKYLGDPVCVYERKTSD